VPAGQQEQSMPCSVRQVSEPLTQDGGTMHASLHTERLAGCKHTTVSSFPSHMPPAQLAEHLCTIMIAQHCRRAALRSPGMSQHSKTFFFSVPQVQCSS
jgi:hypothetical protein